MKRYIIASLVLVFLFGSSTILFSQGRDRSLLNDKDGSINPLNLTDEQYTAIKRIKIMHVKKILQLKSDAMGKQHEFKGLIGDPSASEEAIRAKGHEIETINIQITKELIEYELSVRKILTPEQIRFLSNIENAPAIRKSSGR